MVENALIVVDMQYDFVNPNGFLYVPESERLIPIVNELIDLISRCGVNDKNGKNWLIVYTQDWHNPNSKIFEQIVPHCIQNTKGAELVVNIPRPADSIFIKKGLGDFENYGAFEGEPNLERLLKLRGVKKTFICGVAGDYCVYWTMIQSKSLGFETYYIKDMVKYIDKSKIKKIEDGYKELGIEIIYSDIVADEIMDIPL